MTYAEALARLLGGSPWHRRALEAVAASGLCDAWIAAGAIRDLVWDERFGSGFDPANVKDIDVVYLDSDDLSPTRDQYAQEALDRVVPEMPWQAKNQAAVHLWYSRRFGTKVEPLTSISDAVSTFPETATAVAARQSPVGIEILAPLGLDDLMAGVWRMNPRRVSLEEARARLRRKQPATRWPRVTVIAP